MGDELLAVQDLSLIFLDFSRAFWKNHTSGGRSGCVLLPNSEESRLLRSLCVCKLSTIWGIE